ncbi:hypothetical protein SAMN05216203_2009 [Marinobacter daqiaonensis]|uniref:Uncharacterized protein n=1 Tax=Marinobacter daqiaonensis TaxID=650891 RepID=A0A1I6I9X9_9GAMM|nr:hypothetical protein [Marinobacter daqiaonensis]SFR63491.1 hypothetical protein SAMN05216203_2009 [Marinobacter daqiaonensis]
MSRALAFITGIVVIVVVLLFLFYPVADTTGAGSPADGNRENTATNDFRLGLQ